MTEGGIDPTENRYVGRGGLKLEAALKLFGLEARVRGVHAIDVGASTGGFTDCLLQHGAVRVTALDVGHGQLHTRLRGDERIEQIEGVHFKTLSLSVAPGPYDFFVVDVSFIAARTMLRGLAFRLKPGAEGIILIKPQFELPTGYVRQGNVKGEGLRDWAVQRVRKKGEGLGFKLLAVEDSPVPGGEGTIELLTHWKWEGRGERMPEWRAEGEERKPDEKPAKVAKRSKPEKRERPEKVARPDQPAPAIEAAPARAAALVKQSWFVIAGPGMEELVEKQVVSIIGRGKRVAGGVEFDGTDEEALRVSVWSGSATRVLRRIGEVKDKDFPGLYKKLRNLEWEKWLGEIGEVRASAKKCRLFHTGRIEETVRKAFRDRGKAGTGTAMVMIRGENDIFTVSVDASGELLHRRGWREENALAPLRETLAAAVLELAGWKPGMTLVDPMCGSGTFLIEAAALASGRPPGAARSFTMEQWMEPALVAKVKGERHAPVPTIIQGSDRDAGAVEAARRNAARAGVEQLVRIEQKDVGDIAAPEGTGLVVANPPYGVRIEEVGDVYEQLGRVLKQRFRGWNVAVLTPDSALAARVGLRWSVDKPLDNGGIRVRLYVGRV